MGDGDGSDKQAHNITANSGDGRSGDGSPDQTDRSSGDSSRDLSSKVERLHGVATEMQSASHPTEIYNLTVDAAVDILGFDWCVIQIARDGYFEIAATSERAPVEVGDRPIETDYGITGDSYRTGETILVDDALTHPDAKPLTDQFRSGLTVPVGDRGLFQCIDSRPNSFDTDDVELAELLIAHTTAAVERVEETKRLARLNEATRELMAAETHEEIAGVATDIVSTLLDAPSAVVYLREPSTDTLVPLSATDGANELLSLTPIDPDRNELWSVYKETRTTVKDGTTGSGDADTSWSDLCTALGEHGLLRVVSPVQEAFDENDVALAETIASNVDAAFTRADRERERRRERQELARQNDRLDRFASVVSHDLRNPLNVAMVRTEMLRKECDSDHIDSVADALSRMESIIKDTLSLARQGRIVEEEETERISIGDLARESWTHVDTGGAVLDIEDDVVVRADAARLRHVFENLFRNAVEHGSTPPSEGIERGVDTDDQGEATVHVRMGALEDGFYVEDDGTGIPPEKRAHVFELGYSTDDQGTGFGLAIVKEIAGAHGWEITADESPDGGARFEIRWGEEEIR